MLKIHNTLTGKKEEFVPIEPNKVGMYVCGNTVYDYCHLGHARAMIAFDIIARHLRHLGFALKYVRNFTDVEDKIIKRAAENNETPDQLTERMIAAQREDEQKLGNIPPDEEPRATEFIDEIILMIQTLIAKEFAYQGENGDVYFRVEHFTDYGKLNNRKLDDMLAGARVDIEAAKQHAADFVLWKSAKEGEISWDSPWGKGRPGWHIECSAMANKCLGAHFDIHGGGPDLKFPHHENEIAQSEAANGKDYVNYWMHCGAVRMNNEKMSKSLGNFFTVREVAEKYNPEIIRFFMLSSQYRSPIDYSEAALLEAKVGLERLYTALRNQAVADEIQPQNSSFCQRYDEVMNDDFNTAGAIAVLFDLVRELNKAKKDDEKRAESLAKELLKLGGLLGILQQDPDYFLKHSVKNNGLSEVEIENLIEQRRQARLAKDFALGDQIRDELLEQGITLLDSREGTSWTRS